VPDGRALIVRIGPDAYILCQAGGGLTVKVRRPAGTRLLTCRVTAPPRVQRSGVRGEVSFPELPVVAEGGTPEGERWSLSAAGTPDDYWTKLQTWFADGEGLGSGARGPALPREGAFSLVIGHSSDDEPLSVCIWCGNRVRWVRLHSPDGESCDLRPVAEDTAVSVVFFVALLRWTSTSIAIEGFDANGLSVATGGFDADGRLLRERLT
jgi:hypothetical protein